MVSLCIRYRCSVSDDLGEPWKAFKVPMREYLAAYTDRDGQNTTDEYVVIEALIASENDKEKAPKAVANTIVPLLELVKEDDVFTKFFPISKLFCRGTVVDERSSTALAVAEQRTLVIKKYTSGDGGASFVANRKMITSGPVKSCTSGDPSLRSDGMSGEALILEVCSCRLWDIVRFRNRMLSTRECIVIDLFAHRGNGDTDSFTTIMRLPHFTNAEDFCITSQGEHHNIRVMDSEIDGYITMTSCSFSHDMVGDNNSDSDKDYSEDPDGAVNVDEGGYTEEKHASNNEEDNNETNDSTNNYDNNKSGSDPTETRQQKKSQLKKINRERRAVDYTSHAHTSDHTVISIMLESTPGVHTSGVSKDTLKHYRYSDLVNTDAALDKHHVTGVQWREVPANHAWSSQHFPGGIKMLSGDSVLRKDKGWKCRIRSGIPHIHRWFVVPSIVMGPNALGSTENINKAKQSYITMQDHIFGGVPNELFIPMFPPHFGSMFIDEFKNVIPLISPTGWRHYRISLCCISNRYPSVIVSPIIPAVLAVMYLILTPYESYALLCTLIDMSTAKATNTAVTYFPLCRQSNNIFVQMCADVLRKKCANSAGIFKGDVLQEVLRRIIFSFFTFTFPHVFVMQILDSFLNEGFKIIPRYLLGLFSVFSPQIRASKDPLTFLTGGPYVTNSSYNICTHASFDRIVKVAFGFSLSKSSVMFDVKTKTAENTIKESEYNDGYGMDTGFETKECARIWPHIDANPDSGNHRSLSKNNNNNCLAIRSLSTGGSDLYRREMLFCWLSSYSRLVLLYRSSEHGSSLARLYQSCSTHEGSAALILVRVAGGASVGVFTSHMPTKITKTYNGSFTDFMFSFPSASEGLHANDMSQDCHGGPTRYRATGINNSYVMCERDYLTFGQGPALRLSGDMHTAQSCKCSTFGTDPLFSGSDVSVVEVEVFAAIH